MSDLSKVQEKPDQMNYKAVASPVPPIERRDSLSARATDHRRYRIALGISLAVLLAVLAFGFYATLP